jgi:serine/threonine-protein kinase HipA
VNVKALGIFLGLDSGRQQRIGVLFQYALPNAPVIHRFVADEAFVQMSPQPTLSTAFLADTPAEQQALWRDVRSVNFNGRHSAQNGWLLPAFFQNLLPEGVFRDHVAALRHCDPKDHFEMLAACGKDLPGNVYALPVTLSRDELARYVTQQQDALEMSVTADPLDEGMSLSGVQPKLGVMLQGDRYVGRTKDEDTHIIAKLPVVGQPWLPEVEELSLRLARAAGVDACEASLQPLARLAVQHGYDLGEEGGEGANFVAVVRYDRSVQGRIHCEDFAQVLGEMPEDKYGGRPTPAAQGSADSSTHSSGALRTYQAVAAVLLAFDSMGEPAVHELLRRLVVNELLGNPDMHLKNMGLRYADGRTPTFAPAYDIVAYAVYNGHRGHGLALLPPASVPRSLATQSGRPRQSLSPAMLRAFCAGLGLPEKPAAAAVKASVKAACEHWPGMIETSALTTLQKARLLAHFHAHSMVLSHTRRHSRASSARRADGRRAA